MEYELKYYSENYLEKQFEIGNSHLSTWLGGQQSPIDRLREVYSQEDFDPETKFYALLQGEVVGFITSRIPVEQSGTKMANLEFPLIAPGNEAVEERLMEFALDTLRNKGVSRVVTRASPRWGKTMDFAQKYDYTLKELMWKNARLDVNSYHGSPGEINVTDVSESDLPEIKEILMSFRGNSESGAQDQLELLGRISDRVTSWKIVREAGKIVGHDHLVQDIRDPKKSRMNAIYATRDDIRDSIMHAHVTAATAKGVQFIDNFFFGPTQELDGPYHHYGFEISDLYAFEREL